MLPAFAGRGAEERVADIFREVDEDLRRESAERIWQKYGTYIVAAALLVIVATAAWVGWREWRESQLQADGARFAQALQSAEAGNVDPATATLDALAASGVASYPLLAELQLAAVQAEQGDTAAAVAVYRRIADDDSVRAPYKDLAVVLLALHGFETEDPQALIERLQPLTASSPLRFSAIELTALLHHRAGDDAKALESLSVLRDESAELPLPMRDRVDRLYRIFGGATQTTVAG
jgi:hypothetical protein